MCGGNVLIVGLVCTYALGNAGTDAGSTVQGTSPRDTLVKVHGED